MKTLVIYYSRTGNTKNLALEIAKYLKADIDEIHENIDRSGISGWLGAGRDASKKVLTNIDYEKDPCKYDLVIIGSPIWAFTITPAIRNYLTQNKSKLKKVAFFLTSGGIGIENSFNEMEKLSRKPIAKFELHAIGFRSKIKIKYHLNKIKEFCHILK